MQQVGTDLRVALGSQQVLLQLLAGETPARVASDEAFNAMISNGVCREFLILKVVGDLDSLCLVTGLDKQLKSCYSLISLFLIGRRIKKEVLYLGKFCSIGSSSCFLRSKEFRSLGVGIFIHAQRYLYIIMWRKTATREDY